MIIYAAQFFPYQECNDKVHVSTCRLGGGIGASVAAAPGGGGGCEGGGGPVVLVEGGAMEDAGGSVAEVVLPAEATAAGGS